MCCCTWLLHGKLLKQVMSSTGLYYASSTAVLSQLFLLTSCPAAARDAPATAVARFFSLSTPASPGGRVYANKSCNSKERQLGPAKISARDTQGRHAHVFKRRIIRCIDTCVCADQKQASWWCTHVNTAELAMATFQQARSATDRCLTGLTKRVC
jgi:hypothetical protein